MTNDEWLKSLEPAELKAWFEAEHVEPNDDLPPEKGVSDPDGGSNDANESQDSREKLEADVQRFSQVYYTSHLLVYDKVIELLDRQVAITRRELQDEVDRLTRENMQLARDLGECMAERDGYREKLGRAVDSAWEIVQLMDGDDGE